MKICTNNVPRETVCYWDIPAKDQEWFDYLTEDENIVLDSQVDALIEEYVKGAK